MSQALRVRYTERADVKEVGYLSIRKTIGTPEKVVISVDVEFEQILKNGKTKTVEHQAYLTANFCPWCGEKLE